MLPPFPAFIPNISSNIYALICNFNHKVGKICETDDALMGEPAEVTCMLMSSSQIDKYVFAGKSLQPSYNKFETLGR